MPPRRALLGLLFLACDPAAPAGVRPDPHAAVPEVRGALAALVAEAAEGRTDEALGHWRAAHHLLDLHLSHALAAEDALEPVRVDYLLGRVRHEVVRGADPAPPARALDEALLALADRLPAAEPGDAP